MIYGESEEGGFKEAKVADFGSGIAAGGVANENVTFNWKAPLDIKTA